MSAVNSVVNEIKLRLLTRGIDLDQYMDKAVDSWNGTPKGFKFTFKPYAYVQFYRDLMSSPLFATDTKLGQKFQTGLSFREVSDRDSLHIIIQYDVPNASFKQKVFYANIHLDTIGVCKSKDAKSGTCDYDYYKLSAHVMKDLWHWIK